MGKPCPVSEKRNQSPLPVVGDFYLKLPSCSSVTEKLQGEKLMASYVACANPRAPLQTSRAAATSSQFVESSIQPDAFKRVHKLEETTVVEENSCPRQTLTLKSQTMRTVNGRQEREAQTVAFTLGEQQEVSQVKKRPCPPSTSRDKGHHTLLAFRRRKFRSQGKSEGCTKNRTEPETISIENFTVDFPGTESKWPTDREGDCDDTLETQLTKQYYEVYEEDKDGHQERSNEKFSDCMPKVSKGVTFATKKRLTDRKQVKPFVDLDSKMSGHIFKVFDYCQLNKEKSKLSPSPLDTFARRQQGRKEKFGRENLELTESVAPKTCKGFDKTKEAMINNWLIDVTRVR